MSCKVFHPYKRALFRNTGARKELLNHNMAELTILKKGNQKHMEKSNFLSHLSKFTLAQMIPQTKGM